MSDEAYTAPEQMTLGDLIDALKLRDATQSVIFDFMGLAVRRLDSYRGYYDQLALGYSEDAQSMTVGELLKQCEAADGQTFHGYKGGAYTMDRSTPIWVANRGECQDTAIVGVIDGRWRTVLATAFID